jgi:hypothetical protein
MMFGMGVSQTWAATISTGYLILRLDGQTSFGELPILEIIELHKIISCRVCGDNPQMLCSDSFYCNWTNNPQLWSIAWWNREYVANFDSFLRNDPWYDLEV